jgi:hypothetical protein
LQAEIDAAQVFTLAFATGHETELHYSRAKITAMVFFQKGIGEEATRSSKWLSSPCLPAP